MTIWRLQHLEIPASNPQFNVLDRHIMLLTNKFESRPMKFISGNKNEGLKLFRLHDIIDLAGNSPAREEDAQTGSPLDPELLPSKPWLILA